MLVSMSSLRSREPDRRRFLTMSSGDCCGSAIGDPALFSHAYYSSWMLKSDRRCFNHIPVD